MSQSSPKHIVVTGGAGYLGSVLVPLLLEAGHYVHVIDSLYFGKGSLAKSKGNKRLTLTREDILHQENLPDLFQGVDTVIHLASISNDPTCDLDPNLSIRTNFLATMALARRARAEGVRRFIFPSSCSVYGASGNRWLSETSHTVPASLYALTKLESERELLRMNAENFSVVVLRLATLFGCSPRMRFDLAVNVMAKRVLQGLPIVVNGRGGQYRPFIHVRDAAKAVLMVMDAEVKLCSGQILNVGNEALNYTIAGLADEVSAAFGGARVTYEERNDDIRSYRVRFRKIEEALGYTATRTISDGVRELRQWHEREVFGDMEDENYYNILVMQQSERAAGITSDLAAAPRWAGVLGG